MAAGPWRPEVSLAPIMATYGYFAAGDTRWSLSLLSMREKYMSTRLVYWSYVVSLSVFVLCAVVAAGADEGRLQRYENKEHRVSFSYPNGWRAMSAEEVRRETQGRFDTQKGFVFLVDPRDYDRNVNVAAHRLPPPGVVTDADLATLEVQLDKQYRQIMPDYRKIASRRLDIAGARGLEVVYDTKQLDLPLRQKSLMIPK